MKNSFFSRLRKLGKRKYSEETVQVSSISESPSISELPTPEEFQVKADLTNSVNYSTLKENVLWEMTRWAEYSPERRSRIISYKEYEYSKLTFDRIIQEMLDLGWEVATRKYEEVETYPTYRGDQWVPHLDFSYRVGYFDLLIAYPGAIGSSIQNTDFVVCKEGVSLDGKEYVPQDMGKD